MVDTHSVKTAAATDHRMALLLEIFSGLIGSRTELREEEWCTVLRSLHPADARVVILRVLHGLSNEEIGERLDCSHGRVDQRWKRALSRLREKRAIIQLQEAISA